MRVVVFGPQRRVGAERDGSIVDLNLAYVRLRGDRGQAVAPEEAATLVPADLRGFIAAGPDALERAADALEHLSGREAPDGELPPDLFLSPGDVVEVSSPQVGTLRNRVVAKN